MKASLLFACILGSLFLSSNMYAHCCWTKDNPGFYDLRVEIKNLGTENCDLEHSNIQEGALYGSTIPTVLPATGEAQYVTLSGTVIDVTLTYSCGNNKKISLFMKQYVKKNHKHTSIDASALNVVDVFEEHTIKPNDIVCCSTHNKFGLVSWSLSH